jgi:tRNA 5-methylaminomethyl-2-thiouridine biosynthesis bifunctional protein
MSFGHVTPARIDFSDPAVPRSPEFDDVYHARAGATEQAAHVFLGGNGLPGRWQSRPSFVVLETGFGLGHNFLATWAAWRADARRCERLTFVSIERHPPTLHDLQRAHAGGSEAALAQQLAAAWPAPTPDLHAIDFERGRVRLLLALGDIARVVPELVLRADAIYLDGFAPDRNPAMWDGRALDRLSRLAAPGATLATWCVARAVRERLAAQGFAVEKAPGFGGKREMTVARFAPRFQPAPPPGRQVQPVQHVAVVGAGLAGAGVARALARSGLQVSVIERHAAPASGASGNLAGLFHGVVHGDDGLHERWFRACAVHAGRVLRQAVADGHVEGRVDGLLRLQTGMAHDAMRARLVARSLPHDFVQALHPRDASARAGCSLAPPAWFYPGGGWVSPGGLVRWGLTAAAVALRTGEPVARIEPWAQGWRLFDPSGRALLEADAVVLAGGTDALGLADAPCPWPLQRVRGQVSLLPADAPGLPRLALPLAGQGYALTLPDGRLLFGATSQTDDDDAALRAEDHLANLARLRSLAGWDAGDGLAAAAKGRVGWRVASADRLPLLGAWPAPAAAGMRRDQARLWPRQGGLFAFTALGSRGIAQSLLGGEVLAAWITGQPMPLPASLLDAVDPARVPAKAARAGRA